MFYLLPELEIHILNLLQKILTPLFKDTYSPTDVLTARALPVSPLTGGGGNFSLVSGRRTPGLPPEGLGSALMGPVDLSGV